MFPILFGILLLYIGAETLVRGSSRLAARFGIPPLIIGLTIVAFGTSAPELTVSISAALKGASDVAIGNVVGSNIFNIAVILGVTALIRPPAVHLNLIRREIPFLLAITVIGFVLVWMGHVSRIAGIALFLILCVYSFLAIRAARKEPGESEIGGDQIPGQTPVWLSSLLIGGGLGCLIAGSNLFVHGAVTTARNMGISDAIIGLTIVAAGTSLPELTTSIVAAIRKQADVAIGNIVGSNLFNILCILGLTATVQPLTVAGVGIMDAAFMLGLSAILLPFAFTQRVVSRGEGIVFLAIYGIYLFLLWP